MTNIPPIPEPFNTFMLDVGDGHTLYVEESGNPNGLPLISFHGGPGSHSKPKHRLSYDLAKFRLIFFDQRCSGQSAPKAIDDRAALVGFSPAKIVEDAEKIRIKLGLNSWHVTGGSWGSAMALLYAITYPQATRSLTLRALFLSQESDWAWMAEGARLLAPPAYKACIEAFPDASPATLLTTMADHILTSAAQDALATVKLLIGLEHGLEILTPLPSDEPAKVQDDAALLNGGLLYATVIKHHMFRVGWAFTAEANAALVGKPLAVVHGACDMGCLLKNVYDLKDAHPHAELSIVPNCGHGVDLNDLYDPMYKAALDRLTA